MQTTTKSNTDGQSKRSFKNLNKINIDHNWGTHWNSTKYILSKWLEEFLCLYASANLWHSKIDTAQLVLTGVKIMNDLPEEHVQEEHFQ